MYKYITLSLILLLTSWVTRANDLWYTVSPPLVEIPASPSVEILKGKVSSVKAPLSAADTVPAPKAGLLKKLLQALQFRKNARTREQARVLEIIARSGLKDSLQASVRVLDSMSAVRRTSDIVQQQQCTLEVLRAIELLKSRIDSLVDNGDTSVSISDEGSGGPSSSSSSADVPMTDQELQDLVNQVITPSNPAEQENLALVRSLVFRSMPSTEVVKISDSISESRQYKVRRTKAIIGFYNFQKTQRDIEAYLRLITDLSWYAARFAGSTGTLTNLGGWDKSPVIDSARAWGCRISLCVIGGDEKNITDLLHDTLAQRNLVSGIVASLRLRHADGLQLAFDSLPASSGGDFIRFVARLAYALKMGDVIYSLDIRVPAYDPEDIYDPRTLKDYADYLLLDFTRPRRTSAGPLSPLAGLQTDDMRTCVNRYLNMGIPSTQLIICLPYYGISWKMPDHRTYKVPPGYISYKVLRSDTTYQRPAVWDPLSATQRLDIRNKAGALVQRVWYDNERSLAAKYDLITQKELGGVAIQSLGDDEGYGELWNVLASKFARVDTVTREIRTAHHKEKVLDDWQWSWTYIEAKLEQYRILLAYPCEPKFPKVLIRKWEKAGIKNNDRSMIRKEAATVLGRMSLTLAALFVAGVLLFITKLRQIGDGWKWTKPLAALLIFLFIFLTITAFMYFFLDTSIVYFGVSDSPADCFDFPLGVLFIVIFTGIALGVLITRFLVFPLIKRDDIP